MRNFGKSGVARLGLGLLGAFFSVCCVAQPERPPAEPLTPTVAFPTSEKIATLATAPVTAPREEHVVPVERWSLTEQALQGENRPDPGPEQAPWVHSVGQVASTTNDRVRPSRALDCVAEQAGQFVLERGGAPDKRLLDFMGARCGSYATYFSLRPTVTNVPESVSDERIATQWKPGFEKAMAESFAKAPAGTRVGVWFGRRAGRAVIAIASTRSEADLAPVAVSDSGTVNVVGTLTGGKPAKYVFALVNQGRSGVARCQPDAKKRLPHFSLHCALSPSDKQA
jgi:hypothetical protein